MRHHADIGQPLLHMPGRHDPPSRAQIDAAFEVAQRYEEVAQEIFAFAQHQLSNDQTTFNEVYRNYLSIMQRAHDMYYAVSHPRAADSASSADMQRIGEATSALQGVLGGLTNDHQAIEVSLEALAVAGTVAAAIVDPKHVPAACALDAIGDLIASLKLGGSC